MLDRPLTGPKHLQHRVDPPQAAEVLLVITVWEANVGEAAEAVKVNVAAVAEVTVEVSVIEVGVARAGWCA